MAYVGSDSLAIYYDCVDTFSEQQALRMHEMLVRHPEMQMLSADPVDSLLLDAPTVWYVGETLKWSTASKFDLDNPPTELIDTVDITIRESESTLHAATVENVGYYSGWTPTWDLVGSDLEIELGFHCTLSDSTALGTWTVSIKAPVEFANRSDDSEIGGSFTDQPYAAATLDYDGDDRLDLLISNDDGAGILFRNELHSDPSKRDVPQFVDKGLDGFGLGLEPSDTRGIAVADLDQDGESDVFLTAESSSDIRLFRNTGSSGPWFANYADSTAVGGTATLSSLAANSWTAVFADVDRDGRVDLYIGRASTSAGEPSGALADYLLRNQSDLSTGDILFKDISSTAQINGAGNLTTVSVSIGELGGDKEPEIFVGDYGSSGSVLYRLDSFNSSGLPVYDHQDGGSNPHLPSVSPDDYEEVTGSTWADMDSDGDLDLVLTKANASGNNTIILWSDGDGEFTGAPKKLASGFPISTVMAADLDFSGSVDLLLAPAVDDSLILLLSNAVPAQHASAFEDVTHHVGLDDADTKVTTLVAADFSGPAGFADGDLDLYVGRAAVAPDSDPGTNTSAVYYRSGAGVGSSDDTPRNRWLGIRPIWPAGTGVEWSVVGTVVTIDLPAGSSTPALLSSQILSADGVRSSHDPDVLRFGLGEAEGPATVSILWPDGKLLTTEISDANFNQTHVINATHHPTVVQQSPPYSLNPKAEYQILAEGYVKWIFTWYTDYAADPALEQVSVSVNSGSGCTISGPLTPATTGVTSSVKPTSDGRYKHVFTYVTPCVAGCSFTATVQSAVGSRTSTGTASFNVSTCGGFQE